MRAILAFCCGVLFAFGLGFSGMTRPGKVTAFLDFTGSWDPSFFVMVGAILVYLAGYRLTMKRAKPLLDDSFQVPAQCKIDGPLIGSAIFGIGWGLAGFCPGPALTSIVSRKLAPAVFVVSMIAGMSLFEWREKIRRKARL